MRLVLDQGVPRDAATRFRDLGYECTHVGEIGMWKAPDDEIVAWALEKNGVVVTLDADFNAIRFDCECKDWAPSKSSNWFSMY
jgi:predicted nuclease of predicted toxin-antitoxin system